MYFDKIAFTPNLSYYRWHFVDDVQNAPLESTLTNYVPRLSLKIYPEAFFLCSKSLETIYAAFEFFSKFV